MNQVAVQAAMVVMMALRDMEAGPWPTTMVSHKELQREWQNGPVLVKLLCNWVAQDRYVKLMNLKMEISTILETKAYELSEEEKDPVIKNWFVQEGLQLIQMFTQEEKEKCTTAKDLLAVLCSKFKLRSNRIVVLLQRKNNESAQEWMGRLRTQATECQYKEYDRLLVAQFISGLNDSGMISERVIKESQASCTVMGTYSIRAKSTKSFLIDIKEAKDFDSVRRICISRIMLHLECTKGRTNVNAATQGIHTSSTLHMEKMECLQESKLL